MRLDSDEKYVLDLIEDLVGERYEWQKRFDTLLGDAGKHGLRTRLPVDAFFPKFNLIVEYRERQHSQNVKLWDKRMTVSGIPRGEQRRIYDLRKEKWAAKNKIRFIAVDYADLAHNGNGRLKRDIRHDLNVLESIIKTI